MSRGCDPRRTHEPVVWIGGDCGPVKLRISSIKSSPEVARDKYDPALWLLSWPGHQQFALLEMPAHHSAMPSETEDIVAGFFHAMRAERKAAKHHAGAEKIAQAWYDRLARKRRLRDAVDRDDWERGCGG